QLANRTRFLRSKLASLEAECTELGLGIDTLRQNLGSDEEGMGTWLSTHVQDGVVTQNLHDFLNSSINFVTP
ncbi:hypothetical protein, partial [Klebsiella oxytoca]|uniref:hypothetical protein n=2 Tax=Klebsiella oxytoca TaxID=571 RepID=UPI0025942594